MGLGPYGPWPIWALAHMGLGPYGPWPIWAMSQIFIFKPGFIFKKFDIRNQTLNCKVPTRNKKMAESAGENPLSYIKIWVYSTIGHGRSPLKITATPIILYKKMLS